ncbi:alpha/beta fold hydrolase, partial [Mycobacterium timonense]
MGAAKLRIVHANDGTAIAVREVGPDDAPVKVVFSHGFCLNMNAWAPQQRHLVRDLGSDVKLVFYDHRGHGASAAANPATYTLPTLAGDLNSVVPETTSPHERSVLVGHSMGGMTILAFAARYPQTLQRVGGVGLISTVAAGLDTCGLGRALRTPAVPLLHLAAS